MRRRQLSSNPLVIQSLRPAREGQDARLRGELTGDTVFGLPKNDPGGSRSG
jgi:hypothetical protein